MKKKRKDKKKARCREAWEISFQSDNSLKRAIKPTEK